MSTTQSSAPTAQDVLDAAVAQIGGKHRPGQAAMAEAITEAFGSGRHLLVQAGTGTGKSLGYLAPSLVALASGGVQRVVVATATLALQAQLATKDIPAALKAAEQATGRRPSAAILKGRTNYACRLRVNGGAQSAQESLIDAAELAESLRTVMAGQPEPEDDSTGMSTALGAEVLALREWAEAEHERGGSADRDDAPPHTDRAWQQVSIPVRECLGIQACPFGDSCFVERSREKARGADLVITNHALLAIDAMHGRTALPDHSVMIIDEAHELVSRVTGAASAELHPTTIERVSRRALNYLDDDLALDLMEAADGLRDALDSVPPERIEDTTSPVIAAVDAVRGTSRRVVSALTNEGTKTDGSTGENDRKQAAAAVKEIFDVSDRIVKIDDHDVIWVAVSDRTGRDVRVAPLTVAGLMRDRVFSDRTVIMTSATLKLGGDFTGVAASVGLRADERDDAERSHDQQAAVRQASIRAGEHAAAHDDLEDGLDDDLEFDDESNQPDRPDPDRKSKPETGPLTWRGLDVGTPFDYRRQGIMYVARNLPKPGRDGLGEEVLAEIAELVWAAGGRTLGLFSSRRAAEAAAVFVRKQLPKMTILCQGDAQLPELTRRFVEQQDASLFGTLSLWQGLDVPGTTCQLVIIDRIPFPRPDEPLTVARQRAVSEAGGNGFMAVAATHAALLLAQGSGRLIRRSTDRGVVAVLDPRLATARYGSFLRASMPDMWPTSDRELVVGALRRLNGPASLQ